MILRGATLRREVVVGFSLILIVALALFAGAAYVILQRSLSRTGTQSLRQTAEAAERLMVPPGIPRVEVVEELLPPEEEAVEVLRRSTLLATGDRVDIIVARTGDVERRALRSFSLIALTLIPLTALLAALAGRSLADRILQPLARLVTASREIGIGALSRRVEEPERPAELRELAQSFNGMLERLQRAVETLRSFTADASHELRTPLTAIRGTAEVALARPRTAEELQSTLAEVHDETTSMLHLVEDLLVLARGDEVGPAPEDRADLTGILREVTDVGQALSGDRPVSVSAEVPGGLVVRGDGAALRRLFLNLVSNAVKFTERGEVSVSAAERPDGAGSAEVVVRVRDTGIGIAAADLPRVFDRFYRADAARVAGGTGLGLAIARMIAARHGGSITVESVEGRGTTFEVRLPST
jgi:heavy metal sensor kinase